MEHGKRNTSSQWKHDKISASHQKKLARNDETV